jgi:hypothetical protein
MARLEGPIPAGFPAFSLGRWPTGLAPSGWLLGHLDVSLVEICDRNSRGFSWADIHVSLGRERIMGASDLPPPLQRLRPRHGRRGRTSVPQRASCAPPRSAPLRLRSIPSLQPSSPSDLQVCAQEGQRRTRNREGCSKVLLSPLPYSRTSSDAGPHLSLCCGAGRLRLVPLHQYPRARTQFSSAIGQILNRDYRNPTCRFHLFSPRFSP